MNGLDEGHFHELVDQAQQVIEDVMDDSDLDADIETAGGLLTLRFSPGGDLVISRQTPLRQLWVAARSGGYHLDYDADTGRWYCAATGETLGNLLTRGIAEQTGAAVLFAGL